MTTYPMRHQHRLVLQRLKACTEQDVFPVTAVASRPVMLGMRSLLRSGTIANAALRT